MHIPVLLSAIFFLLNLPLPFRRKKQKAKCVCVCVVCVYLTEMPPNRVALNVIKHLYLPFDPIAHVAGSTNSGRPCSYCHRLSPLQFSSLSLSLFLISTHSGFDAAGMKKRNMMNYVIGGGIMASVFGVYTYSLGAVPQVNFDASKATLFILSEYLFLKTGIAILAQSWCVCMRPCYV